MPYAGELAVAPYLTYNTNTSNTATFTTTETVTDAVTAFLTNGKTYMVEFSSIWNSSVANDVVTVRMREDSLTGNIMNGVDLYLPVNSKYFLGRVRALYTAVSTGSKTFVMTGQRTVGTGNIIRAASSTNPTLFTVERKI